MQVQLIKTDDISYAEELTQLNMAPYYQSRNLQWNHDRFVSNWAKGDNFAVFSNQTCVGFIQFLYEESVAVLRDLQIAAPFQRQGIGKKCLELAIEYARSVQSTQLTLCVFCDNPALNLYKVSGFRQTSVVDGLITMDLTL